MFPLIGILVAAALLFTKRKKTPAPILTPRPASPAVATIKAAPAKAIASVKAPVKAAPVKAAPPIQGLPLPSASQYTADIFGSMLGTNPTVISQTLPYGNYDPSTNSIGQTPPIVVRPTYR